VLEWDLGIHHSIIRAWVKEPLRHPVLSYARYRVLQIQFLNDPHALPFEISILEDAFQQSPKETKDDIRKACLISYELAHYHFIMGQYEEMTRWCRQFWKLYREKDGLMRADPNYIRMFMKVHEIWKNHKAVTPPNEIVQVILEDIVPNTMPAAMKQRMVQQLERDGHIQQVLLGSFCQCLTLVMDSQLTIHGIVIHVFVDTLSHI
jgi:hypothetical protein